MKKIKLALMSPLILQAAIQNCNNNNTSCTINNNESKEWVAVNNNNNNNLINKGTLKFVDIKMNAKLQTLINEGTMTNNNNEPIIKMQSLGSITSLTNKGTIEHLGNKQAIIIYVGDKITSLTNEKVIRSKNGAAIELFSTSTTTKQSHVQNFINKGTIESTNKSAILIEGGSKIDTLDNLGTIKAKEYGIALTDYFFDAETTATISTIKVSGTIEAGIGAIGAAYLLKSKYKGKYGKQPLGKFESISITSVGKVSGGQFGIKIGSKNSITSLKNEGTVSSIKNQGTITTLDTKGTVVENEATITTLTSTGSDDLTLKNSGSIGNNLNTQANNLKVENQGTIGQGTISHNGNGTFTLYNNQGSNLSKIDTNASKVSVRNDKQKLKELNLNSSSLQHATIDNKDGEIESFKLTSGNLNFNNDGGLVKQVTIGGSGMINFSTSEGLGMDSFGKKSEITLMQGASPQVHFDVVKTAISNNQASNAVSFRSANGAQNNTNPSKVNVRKLIIASVDNKTKVGDNVSLNGIITGAGNNSNISNVINSVDFSDALKLSGFRGHFNHNTNILGTYFNSNLGAMGAFSQIFINQLNRRSLFYNSVLNEASRASYRYKITQPHTDLDVFVRPYVSKQKSRIQGAPKDALGNSTGFIAGVHEYTDDGLLAFYGGAEKNAANFDDRIFHLENHTFFLGSKYNHDLMENDTRKWYVGANVRLLYSSSSLDREVVRDQSSNGDIDTYAYEGKGFVGSYFYYDKENSTEYLNPEFAFGTFTGLTKGFKMRGGPYSESLDDASFSVFYSQMNLSWFKRWKYGFATQLDGGLRWNVNTKIDTQVAINGKNFFNAFRISKYYAQMGSSLMWINPGGVDISLGYKLVSGESGLSHNISLRAHKTF